jgi:acetolactate synthase-1/2/3 large subunit
MIKVSDYIFEYLKNNGVDTIFSVSGGAAAHLLNSVSEKNFKYICNHHEQACAMAADGYARIAKKPACVLVTNGPGSSNTITGVLGAYQDSIPMIIISGQVPTKQSLSNSRSVSLRQFGVQECDIVSLVKPITKYSIQITDPNTIPFHLKEAFKEATTGRPGPVWLDIPLDIQSAYIEEKDSSEEQLIKLLMDAKRPLIITGNGIHISNTEKVFEKFKNLLRIPVISTWTSKDIMNEEDDLYVGTFGLFGERAANFAVQNCDLLIILGSRLSIPNIGYNSDLFSPKSIKVMVDIDVNELLKPSLKIDYPINKNLIDFFNTIIPLLEASSELSLWNEWIDKTQHWKKKYPIFQKEYGTNQHKINSFFFMEILSSKIEDDYIIVTDMGTSFTCTMQSLQMNGSARLFTSSACSSMGFGLPGAIGAYMADSNKKLVLIVGDGGMQMNIQELQTIIHNRIPIKIFLLNNNGYLAISLMQDNLFNGRRVGCDKDSGVSNPDFIKIAEAYGIKTYRVSNNKELVDNIDDILNSNETVLCEIMMVENQLLIPRVQSSKDADGKIISNSLENMFPYLSDDEMKKIML